MDFQTFLTLAKAYKDLGWAVQDQLDQLLEGIPAAELNGLAVRMIAEWLEQIKRHTDSDEMADEVDEVLEQISETA